MCHPYMFWSFRPIGCAPKKNDEEILALIRERRGTNKEDRKHIREVSKKIKKCIRDKKRAERQRKNYWKI